MFEPNLVGTLKRVTGRDVHSRPQYSTPADCPFAPVNLHIGAQKTSVRADSSASRGAADEIAAMRAKILVPKYVEIRIGDNFSYSAISYRIEAVHPRYSVIGELDHFECDMEVLP